MTSTCLVRMEKGEPSDFYVHWRYGKVWMRKHTRTDRETLVKYLMRGEINSSFNILKGVFVSAHYTREEIKVQMFCLEVASKFSYFFVMLI